MQTSVTMLYGMTGTFFSTDVRYVHPIPLEADYVPQLPVQAEGEPAIPALSAALISKLREGAFEGRRKAVEKQRNDDMTIWPYM